MNLFLMLPFCWFYCKNHKPMQLPNNYIVKTINRLNPIKSFAWHCKGAHNKTFWLSNLQNFKTYLLSLLISWGMPWCWKRKLTFFQFTKNDSQLTSNYSQVLSFEHTVKYWKDCSRTQAFFVYWKHFNISKLVRCQTRRFLIAVINHFLSITHNIKQIFNNSLKWRGFLFKCSWQNMARRFNM